MDTFVGKIQVKWVSEAAVSSLEHDAGPNYLVMELVEGETLATRLRIGALSIDRAIQIWRQDW